MISEIMIGKENNDNAEESLLTAGDFLLDVHTHTIVSGHAFSTVNEMVAEAKSKGLKVYGITEHGP
jgi:hypothetical protein